ncbi:MAG: response regulator, partial [Breznakibacter sp.]|nr:response regulator [Breznakibacter sp.]
MNIHVIEDEPGFNRLLVESLKQFRESSVLTFTNGHDYIAYLQGLASPFDLPAVITLDLMLPDIDGIELLKRIY